MLLRWNRLHLAMYRNRGFEGKSHGVAGPHQLRGKYALQEARSVGQCDGYHVFLRPQLTQASQDTDTVSGRVVITFSKLHNRRVLVTQPDLDWLWQ